MNTQNKKNWSVILLMAIGILFVTIAGSIFISNTWKLMTESAKEICLAAVTIGLFAGSLFTMKKDNLAITGKALYYLAVVCSGFTIHMLIGLFEDSFTVSSSSLSFIKFAAAATIMTIEMAIIYAKNRLTADLIIAYLIFGSSLIAYSIGLESDFNHYMLAVTVETFLLGINDSLLHKNEYSSNGHKTTGTVLYVINLLFNTLLLGISSISSVFSNDQFGIASLSAIIIFASVIAQFVIKNDYFSKFIATFWTVVTLFTISIDVNANLDIIPDFYQAEFTFILTVIFIVLTRIFWYDKKVNSNVDVFTFVIACVSGLSLLAHNVNTEELPCVLTLGLVSLAVLIWSSIINDKKYQILSGVILGLMAIYLTRSFWLSIAWWVYLLIVGIICIVIAVIKEKNTNKENELMQNFVAEVTDINMDAENYPVEFGKIGESDLDFLK